MSVDPGRIQGSDSDTGQVWKASLATGLEDVR
jgi:hypothetical protein